MKFSMSFPSSLNFLSFFFLSHLLIIFHLVDGQNRNQATCPKEFKCGNLGNMSFPFTERHKPVCGLCLVDCHESNQQINLCVEEDSPSCWPNIMNLSPNKIQIEVEKSCDVFRDLNFLSNKDASFNITSKLTSLVKCPFGTEVPIFLSSLEKFRDCESEHEFTIYYVYNSRDKTISNYNGPPPPHPCSTIHLPLEHRSSDQDISGPVNILHILAENISLEWDDRGTWPCYKCFDDHHQCIVDQDNDNDAHCSNEGKKKKLGLIIIGSVAGIVLTLVICGTIFIIWRQKKRNKDSRYLLSRNMSSDPCLKDNIEVGSGRFLVPVYTYAELEKATDNFDSANELGDGGFGIVYYGRLKDGREVAVKRLYEHNYKRMEHFMNEINILRTLRHPNLVTLYGCTSRHSRELLVYEYIQNGTVADHIHGNKAEERLLTWPIRLNIALDTANAIAHLHKSDIIHRDVKTNNILLDRNFSVKVADFGLSRLFPLDATHISTAPQGTPGYVDPEYHECYQLTDKSDVYSFGVVLVELISSLPAVDITRHRHEINLSNLAISRIQTNALGELIDSSLGYGSDPEVTRMTRDVAELAFRCLQSEKEMRPSMDEVVEILEAIKIGPNNSGGEKGVGISPSPESDGTGLLKNRKLPHSPLSVTEDWVSGSSTASV